jgi:Protein of unknown function (DUF1552)
VKKPAALNRRTFLRGAGGVALSLPVLPSLFSLKESDALAAAPGPKRFVFISKQYGSISLKDMFPADSVLTEKADLYAGHQVSWGKLVRDVNGSNAMVSTALTSPASLFTERLVSQMNIMRGWDIPSNTGHHTGGHLGNYAANTLGSDDAKALDKMGHLPTIDQIMAYSPAFYPGGIRERFVYESNHYTAPRDYSFNYTNTQTKSGAVTAVAPNASTSYWFNKLFAGLAPGSTPPRNAGPPLVDLVIEDYKSLRNSNRRLSTGDKVRLDEFVGRLSELQTKVRATPSAPVLSCTPKKNAFDTGNPFMYADPTPEGCTQKYAVWSELIAMAFVCDVTRVVLLPAGENFIGMERETYHNESHRFMEAAVHPTLTKSNQEQLKRCVLPLVTAMDVADTGGKTILENSLVAWSHENCHEAHMNFGIPIITFGSAGGFLKTGQYFDFRRKTASALVKFQSQEYAGLTHQRWLATVLQAMGIPNSEWEIPGRPGYGHNFIGDMFKGKHLPEVINNASDVPPMLLA